MLKTVLKDYNSLNVLVNCAGIGVARKTYNIHKNLPHPLEEFERVLQVTCNAGVRSVLHSVCLAELKWN